MKEKKDIGNLFKERLGSFEDLDIDQDWNEIELKLHRLKFYRFSLSNFNIYYSSLILITFIFSLTVFIKTFFIKDDLIENAAFTTKAIINNDINKEPLNEISTNTKIKKITQIKKNNSGGKTNSARPGSESIQNAGLTSPTSVNTLQGSDLDIPEKSNHSEENNIGNNPSHPISENTPSAIKTSDKVLPSTDNSSTKVQTKESGLTNTVTDNLNITPSPKKKIVYITRQDTIEIFDTLRRKKPYKRK